MDDLGLSPRRAALLVIDLQERLVPAMPPAIAERVIANTRIAIAAAARLGLPIVVTEQYPQGLGATVAPIAEALAAAPEVHRFDKLTFSVCATAAFAALWPALRKDQWIVTGMETHVCVWQSVRELRGRGASVHVLADAVASRTKANWRIGTGLAAHAGALVSSTEVAVFELLGRAGTDAFKTLSKLIK